MLCALAPKANCVVFEVTDRGRVKAALHRWIAAQFDAFPRIEIHGRTFLCSLL